MSLSNNFPALRPSLLLDFANSETIDPRITFARASTARFYDQNTVAKAEENLLAQSQVFQAWALNALTVTADTTTAPDGTSTADALVETSATGGHGAFQTLTFAAVPYTFSVFLKANTRTWAYLRLSVGAWFNLSTGTVGTVQGGVTAAITSVGNGWYRCSITRTPSAGQNFPTVFVATADGVDSYAGDGTSSIFAWGAQLEERSAVTAYTATTTAPITRYQPQLMTAAANVARLDHDPITREARGLLIEEARSNLMLYTEDINNATWTKTAASITPNATVAPDGTLTADAVIENTATGVHRATQNLSVTPNTYTISAYVKAAGRDVIRVEVSQPGETAVGVHYDLLNQVVSLNQDNRGVNPFIQSVGNGWFRVGVTVVQTGTGTSSMYFYGMPRSLLTAGNSWTGDGYSGFFLWGAQIELAGFASSYIPRLDATAASRAADAASMTGTNFSSWFSAGEGTFYSDVASSATSFAVGARAFTATLLNSTAEQVCIDSAVTRVRSNGVDLGAFYLTTSIVQKRTVAYAQGQQAASAAGAVVESTTAGIPRGLDTLYVGANSLGTGGFLNGHLRKLAFYPRRLTNAQLQALTR